MPSTYTLISSNVLSASAASVTFSSIPSTYTDLVLRGNARGDQATLSSYTRIRFNGSTTTYSKTIIDGGLGSISSSSQSSANSIENANGMPASTATASTFGSLELYIPNYTTAINHPISQFSVTEGNASAYVNAIAGLWSTASAITQIDILTNGGGNFVSGSSFYLYGISKS